MKEVVKYLYKSDLVQSIGTNYKSILHSLKKSRLINSYKEVIEVVMDKDKSIHFQTMLAFHEITVQNKQRVTNDKE